MKPYKQQGRQTDQSVCLMQVKETAEHRRASIHPSFLPFRYSICAVYVTRRQDKKAPRRGGGRVEQRHCLWLLFVTVTTDMEFRADSLSVQLRTEYRNREHSSITSRIRIPVGTRIYYIYIIYICVCVCVDKIDEYGRNWFLHLQRVPQDRIPLKSYHYRPQGRKTIGRPKKRWREQL